MNIYFKAISFLSIICVLMLTIISDGQTQQADKGTVGVDGLKEVTVNLAKHPAVADMVMVSYVEDHQLFEKYAKEYGYKIKIERPEFSSGGVALEALLGRQLDITIVGQLPALSSISKKLPVYLGSGSAGGRNGHAIMVRPDGNIKSLDDLVKKKGVIATVIGSSGHNFLDFLFRAAYNKTPKELGLQVLNMPPAQAMTFPSGIDAVALWSSFVEQIVAKKTGEILLTDHGVTGPAWKDAPGPGKKIDFFKNSIFYPEGFCLYRNFTVYNKDFVDKYPDLVVAYLKASQTAAVALRQDTEQGRDLSWKYIKDVWRIPRELTGRIFADDLSMGIRHWIWITYGDVKAITWSSEWASANGIIPRNVTWEDVAPYFSKLSALEKRAWEELKEVPPIAEMTKEVETDLRGLPTWMMSSWPNKYP